MKKPRRYRYLTILLISVAIGAIYVLGTRLIVYRTAPFDSPNPRSIHLIASSEVESTISPHESGEAVYHIHFLLHISVDRVLLNLNQSENLCVDPQVTSELPPNTRMNGEFLENEYRIPEALWLRGTLRVDSWLVVGAVQASYFMAYTAVTQCFNVSNLPVGTHTIDLDTSLETGETFSPSWQILIEQ